MNPLPRWRGFNLLDFASMASTGEFQREDLILIREWGFDFVRLPLNYRLWADHARPFGVREQWLEPIDRAVESGVALGLHVCLSFHRAPGHTVSREGPEPLNLWKDQQALDLFVFHWQLLAERFAGVSPSLLSFNLVNEPKAVSHLMSREDHEHVIRSAVEAIRCVDPDRMIIIDGLRWGRDPVDELLDLGVAQSCRGYDPFVVSHHGADWSSGPPDGLPTWPARDHDGSTWDRLRLRAAYAPWARLIERGCGIHCGELGCYNRTPHGVALAWLRDLLATLTTLGIGWALWNLRGPFGVLDSGRGDVAYEDASVGALDRALLNLLQEF